MGKSLLQIQKQFNELLLNGVGYNILNNPVISWDNGFIKTITAICALIAIIDVASKIASHKDFLTSLLKLAFMFVLVLMNFGQINPRSVFDVGIKGTAYDYLNKPEPKSAEELRKSFNMTSAKSVATLDREIFNGLQQYFDGVATMIGTSNSRLVSNDAGYRMDLQEAAMQSTLFFLAQVKLAKLACLAKENQADYGACLGQFIPVSPPIGPDGKQTNACKSGPCKSKAVDAVAQGASGGTSPAEPESWGAKLLGGGTLDALSKLVEFVVGFYATFYTIFSDFLFMLTLPLILWILEFVRTLIAVYIYIIYGFQAVGLLVFAKIMSPMILLERQRGEVIKAYQNVFAMTLFGFVSQLFIFFSTILTLGLRDATFQAIAPTITGGVSGNAVDFTSNIGTLTLLVYTSMFVIMMIQIQAMQKIIPACKALMNFSIGSFVTIGEELGAAGVKMGLMLAGAAVGGAALGGAALTAKLGAGLASKVGGAAMKGSFGKGAASLAKKGSGLAQKAQRSALNMGGKITDSIAGSEAGDKFRHLFGGGGTNVPGNQASVLGKKAGGSAGNDMSNLRDGGSGDKPKNDDDGGNNGGGGNKSGGNKKGGNKKGGNKKVSSFKDDKNSGSGGNGGGESGSSASSDDTNPFSKENKKKNKDMKSETRKPGFLNNKWIKAGLGGAKMGMNLSSGVLGMMEAGASGQMKNPLSAISSFGKSFKEGAGNTIAKKYQENVVNGLNKSMDEIAADPVAMKKLQEYNLSIDNVSGDQKMAAQTELADTVNAQNYQKFNIKQNAEYEDLLSKGLSSEQLDEKEMNQFYNYSNNYNLNENQKKQLAEVREKNEKVGREFSSRKKVEQSHIQEYTNAPTAQNSAKLSSAIASGSISVSTLKENSGNITDNTNKQTKEAVKQLSNNLNEVEMDRMGDDSYRNSARVKNATNQAREAITNSSTRAALISKDNTVALNRISFLTGEDVSELTKMDNEKEVLKVLKEFQQDANQVVTTKKLNLDEKTAVWFDGQGNPVGVFRGNDKISDKIVARDMNTELKHKMSKYKDALEIMNNNPERFKDIRDEDKKIMRTIADLIG